MKERMLYFCPVDWYWIKQRPQFLAETLNEYYDIRVIYPYKNDRKGLQKKRNDRIHLAPCYSLPFAGKFRFIKIVNRFLLRMQFWLQLICVRPDVLWLSMPWQMDLLPKCYYGWVVYDCMDDYPEIEIDRSNKSRVIEQESQLLKRADMVFVSSLNLKHVLEKRYGLLAEEINLLRNGYYSGWVADKNDGTKGHDNNRIFRIGYFGTIGRWFDFHLLLNSLENVVGIEYHLFGPLEKGVSIPENPGLIYHGVVEHDMITQKTQALDALIMPFIVNDIVRSVDPVKLYEYIWLNKNILCVCYEEIKRFEPFVYFYENDDEYIQQLERLLKQSQTKYSTEQAEQFLEDNNWASRARTAYYKITRLKMKEN